MKQRHGMKTLILAATLAFTLLRCHLTTAQNVPLDQARSILEKSEATEKAEPTEAERRTREYPSIGAPSRPRVVAHWNRYHDYREASRLLRQLANKYPEIVRLESLGKSYGGRNMWVATITNFQAPGGDARPGFWIDGGIHANEIQSVEAALYTAWFLAESYAENDMVKRLLDERIFYICPMMSPDSRDAHFYEPNTTHSPRTGQRPVDDDRDGRVDEDGADDLNGDGHITEMRIRDPNGDYKSDPEFPDMMVRVKPGEQGEFRLLGSEGIDNDDDGLVNEDGPGGYDPNRDWGWFWQPRHIQGGAYRYPFSIEENRLVADFIRQHPNIGGAQSYHNAGGMILRGPGAKSDAYPQSDVLVYDALGRKGEQMLPGYRYMNVAQDLYEVYGGEIDWLHCSQGIFAFTNELFTPFNYFREREEGRGYFGSSETQRRFNQLLLLNQGFVPWTETVHPQYGRVEVGGVKKSWQRQPPSFLLEEECHRNMAFTLYHADQLPQVSFQDVTARRLSAELLEITAIVENSRLIPTRSAINIRYKITPPDIVSIEGKDLEVVTAMLDHEPFFREATAQTRNPAQVTVDQIPGQGVVYVRWYVKDATQGRVKVKSVKGGEDEIEFNVELGR